MALTIQDIFPLSTTQGSASTAKILEPYACSRQYNDLSETVVSEARLVYTKVISKPYYMFQYSYKSIMAWEYQLLEDFYRRMKGRYETFYLVDWSSQYRITASTPTSVTVDRISGLDDDTGFGGNTVLIYNPIKSGTNKQILTIASFSTLTLNVNEAVTTSLASAAGTMLYVLYPCMFDTTSLQNTIVDFCIQRNVISFPGYGNRTLYGTINDVNIPFIQVGVMK